MVNNNKNRKTKTSDTPQIPWWKQAAIRLSIIGIIISILGFFYARKAYDLNYQLALPAISIKVAVVEPIQLSKNVMMRVTFDNRGHSTAKDFKFDWRYKVLKGDTLFTPDFGPSSSGRPVSQLKSDLQPEGHREFNNVSYFNITDGKVLSAIISGELRLYAYGKITYIDLMGSPHEIHLCRFYQPTPGASDPLLLAFCDTFNDIQ